MDPSSRKWKSFGVKDNVALEKLYCDVSVEKQDHFKPAQALELTYSKRQVILISSCTLVSYRYFILDITNAKGLINSDCTYIYNKHRFMSFIREQPC